MLKVALDYQIVKGIEKKHKIILKEQYYHR